MPHKQPLPDKGIVRVTFTLPADVEGRVVHLVGEFTGWEGTPMERQTNGSWRTVVDLAPGRSYEFRYHINGERWENDWDADGYTSNPFGQENSVVETPKLKGAHGARSLRKTAAKPKASGKAAGAQATGRNAGTTQAERELATSAAATGAGGAAPASAKRTATKNEGVKKGGAKRTTAKKAGAKKATASRSTAKQATTKQATTKQATTNKAGARAAGARKTTRKSAAKKVSASPQSSPGTRQQASTENTGNTTARKDDASA